MPIVLDEQALRRTAGDLVFERGRAYHAERRVFDVSATSHLVRATVRGVDDYEVRIESVGGALRYACGCPAAENMDVCKHVVAAALAWMNGDGATVTPPARKAPARSGAVAKKLALDRFIRSLPAKELLDIVLNLTESDRAFRRHMEVRMAATVSATDLRPMRSALKRAILHTQFIDYYHARDYADKVHDVLDQLEAVNGRGQSESAILLCEYGLEVWEKSWDVGIDDSNGEMGDILDRLSEIHLEACRQVHPEPVELAQRLFGTAINSEWDVFLDVPTAYAGVLGSEGLKEYRRLADEVWSSVRPLGPGEDGSHQGNRFKITHMMEQIARQTGDVEQMVEVRRRDLSSAYGFMVVADLYAAAGQPVRAIEWAERGMAAFPAPVDSRLANRLVELYEESGRHSEAVGQAWENFVVHPELEQYQRLKAIAGPHSTWEELRSQAIDHLRGLIAGSPRAIRPATSKMHFPERQNSTLIEILLWEGNTEAAWQAATTYGCHRTLWLKLAGLRSEDYPLDAVSIYEEEVDALIDQKTRVSYERAVETLSTIKLLTERAGCPDRFETVLQAIVQEQRAKRSLIALLAARFA